MKMSIDIENSKTGKVITLNLNIIKIINKNIEVDISSLSDLEKSILKDAIDNDLTYIDIELFYIDDDPIPFFGPDYTYKLLNNILYLTYSKKNNVSIKEEEINPDWTLDYENEFNPIALDFIKSSYNYLIIYYDNELKYDFQLEEPPKDIFKTLIIDNNYKAVSIYKKKDSINSTNIRDNLFYINSYSEIEKVKEKGCKNGLVW